MAEVEFCMNKIKEANEHRRYKIAAARTRTHTQRTEMMLVETKHVISLHTNSHIGLKHTNRTYRRYSTCSFVVATNSHFSLICKFGSLTQKCNKIPLMLYAEEQTEEKIMKNLSRSL